MKPSVYNPETEPQPVKITAAYIRAFSYVPKWVAEPYGGGSPDGICCMYCMKLFPQECRSVYYQHPLYLDGWMELGSINSEYVFAHARCALMLYVSTKRQDRATRIPGYEYSGDRYRDLSKSFTSLVEYVSIIV